MKLSVNFTVLVLACSLAGVSAWHILGVFVNVHRSQLIVYLAVARVLLQRGHQLTLVTTLPLENDWLTANITHILVPWSLPAEPQQQQHDSNKNFVTQLQWLLARLELSGELLQHETWRAFMQNTPRQHFDLLLLGYHFNEHLLGVAAHFDCPVAIISTQQPIALVHSLMGNPEERWYVPQPYDSRQKTGLGGCLFGLFEKSTDILARYVMQGIYDKHFPAPHYPSFDAMRRRVVLALNNHHMISEGPIAPLLPSMLDIGGIVLEQSAAAGDLNLKLPKRPFILFSLGTRVSWLKTPAHWEQCFVAAFAQLADYDIYWTYNGHNASGISLAHTHIKLAQWWPQLQLLAQPTARLFITHGGKGSLSEALYHGVPLLGMPLIGDQHANLHKMQAKGWGLSLDMHNVSQVELLKVMSRLLGEPQFRQSIQRDSRLYRDRPLNASTLTAYWLEYVMRHKGAKNLYSTTRNLNFWQYNLLDVRLLIYGSLAIFSWVLVRILRCLD